MPNNDKTGPKGQGPMTGRGMGACGNGNNTGGFGRGRGCGMGLRRNSSLSLDDQEKLLEERLEEVRKLKKNS